MMFDSKENDDLGNIASNRDRFPPQKLRINKGMFWEARTRIFAWYTILITLFVGISIPLFTKLVFLQVDRRVREDLIEEIESFQKVIGNTEFEDAISLRDKAAAVFDNYLRYQVPADKTFIITTINGKFYRSSPIGLPQVIDRNSQLFKRLSNTSKSIRGQNTVEDKRFGKLLYKTEPLIIEGKFVGVVIFLNIINGERKEVFEAIIIVIQVLIAAFLVGLILAWIAAGRVLSPIRDLMKTARSISDRDLSQRIPVQGRGEMAELAGTFNRMMDRLELSFKTQREFINDAGHELRTPITIIRGHLELLEDDPQERAATIALVMDELARMTRFVEDLIFLAKAERREFLKIETVDIEQFTAELYAKARGLASRNWKLAISGGGTIAIDRQKITQAMMNLAANATQHTTDTDSITIGSIADGKHLRLWVKDTGTGIAPTDRERIFSRFARAANSRRRSEGAGLGLSIVRAIAKSHGGKVELYSQLRIGSTFTVTLPLNKDNQ